MASAQDVLPSCLSWLQQAEPAKCYSGHEMEWTDLTAPSSISTGDVVGMMDPTTCREVQQAAELWSDWMATVARRTGTVVKCDALSKASAVVEVRFDAPISKTGTFSTKCLKRQLRMGDMVQTTRKVDGVDKGAIGVLHSYSSSSGGNVSFGSVNVKVQASAIVCLAQKWRCGAPQCRGGHATAGMWRWCCFVCGLNLCCVCKMPPPQLLRKLFHSKLPISLYPTKLRSLTDPSDTAYHLPGLQDWVILRSAQPKYGLGDAVVNDVGVVVGVDGDECTVKFAAFSDLWRAMRTELQTIPIGQKVIVKDGAVPSADWGDLNPHYKIYGVIKHIEPDGSCLVKWDGWNTLWTGHLTELHVVLLCVGDAVALQDSVTPSFGFGNAAYGDIGLVTSLQDAATVQFVVQSNWKGIPQDLQQIGVGSAVSVHKLVTPQQGWQGTAPGEVGRIVSLNQTGACEVAFPSNRWVGNVMELELKPLSAVLTPRATSTADPMGPPLPTPDTIDQEKLNQLSLENLGASGSTGSARLAAFRSIREKLKMVYAAWDANASYHGTYNNLYRWVMIEFAQVACGNKVVLSEEGKGLVNGRQWGGLLNDEVGLVTAVDESGPWFVCVRTPSGAIVPHLRSHIKVKE
eukprot:TRINITY_DN6501_c0_g3_i1.p1 TRINITY_DN6501_c0_g3~~TRINITY_DN6501_c0_g3_i1.p1  ORF type:complete len:630 (+),score=94.17 TRINITY_DN6501_c0_g3_i1:64-1953(+)